MITAEVKEALRANLEEAMQDFDRENAFSERLIEECVDVLVESLSREFTITFEADDNADWDPFGDEEDDFAGN